MKNPASEPRSPQVEIIMLLSKMVTALNPHIRVIYMTPDSVVIEDTTTHKYYRYRRGFFRETHLAIDKDRPP